MFKRMNTSTKIIMLMTLVIALFLTISITMTYRSNNKLIVLQAKKMAQTVANQVIADRSHYVKRVVKKVKGTPYAPQEGFTDASSYVPLPATFVMGVADDVSASQNEYQYKLVSRWNINPGNSLSDDFLQRGFAGLVEQERRVKAEGKLSAEKAYGAWEPYYETLDINGKPYLRFLAADVAAGQACVSCHNKLENRDDVLAIRRENNVELARSFQLNDLMGAVAVDVNLEEAGAVAAANSRHMVIWLTVVGSVVVLVTIAFVKQAMVKPVNAMIQRLDRIAEGDLTQSVEENRQGEFGRLAHSFNTSIKQLHDAIVEVNGVTAEVTIASTEISAASEEMVKGMRDQDDKIIQISSAVEEMSTSIVEVANKAASASSTATTSGEMAKEGGSVVEQTVGGMKSISQAVEASAVSVTELGKRGEQIGQVIDVINDIADQTNLLALNAAIEAARAGEHGRGFAVVADEVRKLADRTTKATGEVAESIKAIQTETDDAVERMNAGTQQVSSGVELASQAGDSLNRIVAGAQEVADMIQSIAAAAEQQGSASEQVSRALTSVSSISEAAREGAEKSSNAVMGLAERSRTLQNLISRFKVEADSQKGAAKSAHEAHSPAS